MLKLRISLNKCWATKADIANADANQWPANSDADFNDPTGGDTANAANQIVLWEEFCPKYEWVGPAAYESGVLGFEIHFY